MRGFLPAPRRCADDTARGRAIPANAGTDVRAHRHRPLFGKAGSDNILTAWSIP